MAVSTVDYATLDAAKLRFIEASKRTLRFAQPLGSVLNEGLGASANVLSLDLSRWHTAGVSKLNLSLVPEGLGTADDARPPDLSEAELTEFWFNIGVKAVAVITNDSASAGLQAVAIGLYLPSAQPEVVFSPPFLKGFLDGFVSGCEKVGCVYLSGETPQLKSKMLPHALDIAGACVAIGFPDRVAVNPRGVAEGDTIVLVASSGPHENGFTTLRALADKLPQGYHTKVPGSETPFWKAINKGSCLYTSLVQEVLKRGVSPSSLENITGHGWQKLMRSAKPLRYEITEPLPLPPLFAFIEQHLQVSRARLLELFNCGAGFAFFLESKSDAHLVTQIASELGFSAQIAGQVGRPEVVAGLPQRSVVVPDWGVRLSGEDFALRK